jgi:hypothetical protein
MFSSDLLIELRFINYLRNQINKLSLEVAAKPALREVPAKGLREVVFFIQPIGLTACSGDCHGN